MKQHLPPPRRQLRQWAEGTARPLGKALKSGLWPGPSGKPRPPTTGPAPELAFAFQPSCSVRGTPAQLPGLGRHHRTGWGLLFGPQLSSFLLALPPPWGPVEETLPENSWDFPLTLASPSALMCTPNSFLLPESPLSAKSYSHPTAKDTPPLPTILPLASASPGPSTCPGTDIRMNAHPFCRWVYRRSERAQLPSRLFLNGKNGPGGRALLYCFPPGTLSTPGTNAALPSFSGIRVTPNRISQCSGAKCPADYSGPLAQLSQSVRVGFKKNRNCTVFVTRLWGEASSPHCTDDAGGPQGRGSCRRP